MQKLKKIFSRQNGLVLLLVLVEFMVLALRFVGDFRTGEADVLTCNQRFHHGGNPAGVRLQGVRQLLRGDKPGGARRQQGYSETLRLQRL